MSGKIRRVRIKNGESRLTGKLINMKEVCWDGLVIWRERTRIKLQDMYVHGLRGGAGKKLDRVNGILRKKHETTSLKIKIKCMNWYIDMTETKMVCEKIKVSGGIINGVVWNWI